MMIMIVSYARAFKLEKNTMQKVGYDSWTLLCVCITELFM
jgi:hypothetical protein